MNYITLNNTVRIDQLGFGLFQVKQQEAIAVCDAAIETGYRHFDTAAIYGNEKQLGESLQKSGINRDEFFITSKVWNADIRKKNTGDAFKKSLDLLQLDYLDLYLIHWAVDNYEYAYEELAKLYEQGFIRSIGVSNFSCEHLQSLQKISSIVPAVNQIELHPYLRAAELTAYCTEQGIHIEAWSPLCGMGGLSAMQELFAEPAIQTASKTHNKTPAQIILRWHIQHNHIIFPKTSTQQRIQENFAIFDFELSEAEQTALNALDRNQRFGPALDNVSF